MQSAPNLSPNKPKLVVNEGKQLPAEDKKSLAEQVKTFQQYLKEVVVEFRKISWPDRTEIARATLSVLVLVAIITLLVLGFDFLLSKVIFGPLDHWVRLHGGLVGR